MTWGSLRLVSGVIALVGCATAQSADVSSSVGGISKPAESASAARSSTSDSTASGIIPAGYGSMRQDDIALHIDGPGLRIRILPLDESIIRALTPDSYKSTRDLKTSKQKAIDAIARRFGARETSVWLVSFYGVEQDTRFSPMDLTLTSAGRDFRPYDVIPLTTGFSEQQLRQRETQNALYVFDGEVPINQPLIATYQQAKDESWEKVLQKIERERALILARASKVQQ